VECDDVIATKVGLVYGSVAFFEADAILSSVNESLSRGGGVDGAVRRAAGSKIETELALSGGISCGECIITRGYRLPAKYVLHSCGPVGRRPKSLARCYKTALDVAVHHKLRTIGLCGLSSGNNGYPLTEAIRVSIKTVRRWLEQNDNKEKIDKIVFVCFETFEVKLYEQWMQKYFPSSKFLDGATRELENMHANTHPQIN